MALGTVKQWNDDEGWGVLISPEVPGDVWALFSHVVVDDDTDLSLSDGERVRFGYEHFPSGQDGYFWRALWVVRLSDDSEYAVMTDAEITDRVRAIEERRRAPHDPSTYTIIERIEVVKKPEKEDDPRGST